VLGLLVADLGALAVFSVASVMASLDGWLKPPHLVWTGLARLRLSGRIVTALDGSGTRQLHHATPEQPGAQLLKTIRAAPGQLLRVLDLPQ
jgi:hypothetical protein